MTTDIVSICDWQRWTLHINTAFLQQIKHTTNYKHLCDRIVPRNTKSWTIYIIDEEKLPTKISLE